MSKILLGPGREAVEGFKEFEHWHVPLRDKRALVQLLLKEGYRFTLRGEYDALAERVAN